MPSDERNVGAALYPATMLLATGLFLALGDSALLVAAAILGLGASTIAGKGRWTPGGYLGWANALTWLRILATGILLLRGPADSAQVFLAFAIFALDGADGAIARARKTSSEFGADLDKECDAFFVLALAASLWAAGIAGPWVLIAGIWRYGYSLLLAVGPLLTAAPRSSWARYTYSTSSCLLMAALYPGNPLATSMAALAVTLISASFLRSLYYSFLRS